MIIDINVYIFTSISSLSSSLFFFPSENSTSPWSMGGGSWLCSVSAGVHVSSAGKTNCNFWSPLVFPLNILWNSLLIWCFLVKMCLCKWFDLSKETPQTIQGNAIRNVNTRASMFSTRFDLLLIFYLWNKRWCNKDYSAAAVKMDFLAVSSVSSAKNKSIYLRYFINIKKHCFCCYHLYY